LNCKWTKTKFWIIG